MRTNPFYDAWLFLIGRTGDHGGSGVGWLLTLLFLILLVASAVIAYRNWQADLEQRTGTHLSIWLMRVLIGSMWFQGAIWKLPLPVSGGFAFWTGEIARYAAFDWLKWLAATLYLPLIKIIDPLVLLFELALAVSFMLGFLTRLMAVLGMLYVAHLWLGLYQHPNEWPWSYIFLIFVQGFFVLCDAGKSLGLDALLTRTPVGPFAGDGRLAHLYRTIA